MADRIQIQTQVLAAAARMPQEILSVYRAMFDWLPGSVDTLFLDDNAALAGTVVAVSTVATSLLTVEVTAGTAACRVHFWDAATGSVTLATLSPAPQFSIGVPADSRILIPFFAFQSSEFGWRFATACSMAAVDTTAGYVTAAPAAAQPSVRTIARVD